MCVCVLGFGDPHPHPVLLRQCPDSINEPGLRFPGNAYVNESRSVTVETRRREESPGCHGNAMSGERPGEGKVASDFGDVYHRRSSS